jgi:hypothetical protein
MEIKFKISKQTFNINSSDLQHKANTLSCRSTLMNLELSIKKFKTIKFRFLRVERIEFVIEEAEKKKS